MSAGYGLSVRWSLADAPEGVEAALRDYVVGESMGKFARREGLSFKTWRMREGEWFEGTYVWATQAARDSFAQTFAAEAATSPGSKIIGSAPELIEPFEVVAIAEGPSGFSYGAGPGEM
ncbi:MAG: hypothetical protein ACXVYY_16610 [Oryzihumus sp.]